jgi:serine/threonine protein phosphatase 1
MMRVILEDISTISPPDPAVLVFLGDYVDRGGQSRNVIDYLDALGQGGFEVHTLKGNHEEAMLRFLDEPGGGPAWAIHGGSQTLQSYGVGAPMIEAPVEMWEQARRAFNEALPDTHRAFLQNLKLSVTIGSYLFVHAGLRPGVAIERQSEHDMLWIREPFLSRGDFESIVVHGHTPASNPYLGASRIGVDTGAYASGVLTAVRLCDETQTFIQVSDKDDD